MGANIKLVSIFIFLYKECCYLIKGRFYFVKEEYYKIFKDKYLMKNRETIEGKSHNRPCYYSFLDEKTGLYWLIPISSKIYKYEKIYLNKIQKNGKCDTIILGKVLGYRKVFLLQNMFPIIDKYISNEYIDKNQKPVHIDKRLEKEIDEKAKKVLSLHRQGINLIFPDVEYIEQVLTK